MVNPWLRLRKRGIFWAVEAVGVEPTDIGFKDPASNLAAPTIPAQFTTFPIPHKLIPTVDARSPPTLEVSRGARHDGLAVLPDLGDFVVVPCLALGTRALTRRATIYE
jgi:hypothetical protein